MDTPAPTSSAAASPSRRWIWALLMLLVGVTAGVGWWRWRAASPPDQSPPDDPRLTYPTPYLNVRPDVQYVGDAACATCHPRQSEPYHNHPMGQSVAAATDPRVMEHLDKDGRASFDIRGRRYVAERRGDKLFHRELVLGPAGETIAERQAEVQFVIGSGRRGFGFLIEDNGYLFQSSMSWYKQRGVWDLSPGYRDKNEHFDRAITPGCLFCHSNRVEPVAGSINRYQAPIFRGETIGCERCHGPGELHVQRQTHPKGEADYTIVNPRRLEQSLRESVCEQCHLQGAERVVRRGRQGFDYRPGLPLHLFWSVFEIPPDRRTDTKAVGQAEQMHISQCYRESKGQLGCTSCHDPHRLPADTKKADYYRPRCLNCHETKVKNCSKSAQARLAKGDDCAACHMPRRGGSDVIHVAVSDHRILREPTGKPPREEETESEMPLIHFHRDRLPAEERDAWIKRDLGVAMMNMAAQAPPGPGRQNFAELALPLLEEATAADANDLPAWEALAYARRFDDRLAAALQTYDTILTRAPDRELALAEAAAVAGQLQNADRAADYMRRAIALNPRRWQYRYQFAVLLQSQRQPAEALEQCEQALTINPLDVPLRKVQVACLLDLKRFDSARTAFETLMVLKPPDESQLRRWFQSRLP